MSAQIDWDDFAGKIAEYTEFDRVDITRELTIYGDLGMDSLGLFSLGMHLQNVYPVKVPFASVATIETLGDIFDLLNAHASRE